jgi:hypothetical protein
MRAQRHSPRTAAPPGGTLRVATGNDVPAGAGIDFMPLIVRGLARRRKGTGGMS